MKQTLIRRGLPTRRMGLYELGDPNMVYSGDCMQAWLLHRGNVQFVLGALPAAFRVRHDPHARARALAALKSGFAALDTFNQRKRDKGAADFARRFPQFRGDWNELVAVLALDRPRKAAEALRRKGDATRDDVKHEWDDAVRRKIPERERVGIIASNTGKSRSAVVAALDKLGLRKKKMRPQKSK